MENKFQYCFILGNNHSLCKVEIINVLFSHGVEFKLIESSQETLVIESTTEFEKDLDFNIFGSASKLVKIFKTISLTEFFNKRIDQVVNYDFLDFFVNKDAKHPSFGLSVYGAGCRFKDLNYSWYLAPTFCRDLRDELKTYGIKTGFIPLKERILSTVSVDKNELLTQGFEINLAIGRDTVYIGKTISIQDYESYSFRDYGRPNRDPKSGMIPPKLAKMMINLTNKTSDQILLDPFCGSGTVLEEMILLDFKKITGSDISFKAITDTNANIAWLFENYPNLNKPTFNINVLECDVTKISSIIEDKSIDAIVTEPFLGSADSKKFRLTQIQQEVKRLEGLYFKAFMEFKKIVKRDGVIVIVFPVYKHKADFLYLSLLDRVKQLGFSQKPYLPEKYLTPKNLEILNLQLTERNSIVYYRPDQTVSREIFIFEN